MSGRVRRLLEDLGPTRTGPVAERVLTAADGRSWFAARMEEFGRDLGIAAPRDLLVLDQPRLDRVLTHEARLPILERELLRLLLLAAASLLELDTPYEVSSADSAELLDLCAVLDDSWWELLEAGARRLEQGVDGEAEALLELGYRPLARLGRGGSAHVLRALQESTGAQVALKVVELDRGEDRRARLREEVRSLGRLDHPNVARLLDVQEFWSGGRHAQVLVLELVRGWSILEYVDLQPAPQDARARTRLVLQAARAMAHAHSRGVLHRDLHPGNLLVDEHGRVRVIDFGIARDLDSATPRTRTGTFLGTPDHSPPEQLEGRVAEVGRPADVYSLGVVLFRLLAGRPPHDLGGLGAREAVAHVLAREAPDLARLEPELDPDLCRIVGKALERAPRDRYPDAGELAADLERYLDHRPVSVGSPTWTTRVRRWCRRHPRRSLAASLGGGFGLLIAATLQLGWSEAARAESTLAALVERSAEHLAYLREDFEHLGSWERVAGELDRMEQRLAATGSRDLRLQALRWRIEDLRADRLHAEGRFAEVRTVREGVLDFFRAAVEREPTPEHRADLALALVELGDVLKTAGEIERTLRLYREARDLHRDLVADRGGERWLDDLFWSELRIGRLGLRVEDLEGARTGLERAGEVLERLRRERPDDTRTLHAEVVLLHHRQEVHGPDLGELRLLEGRSAELLGRDRLRLLFLRLRLGVLRLVLGRDPDLSPPRRAALERERDELWQRCTTLEDLDQGARHPIALVHNAQDLALSGDLARAELLARIGLASALRGERLEPGSDYYLAVRARASEVLARIQLRQARPISAAAWSVVQARALAARSGAYRLGL